VLSLSMATFSSHLKKQVFKEKVMHISRRFFVKSGLFSGASLAATMGLAKIPANAKTEFRSMKNMNRLNPIEPLDLSPARWIWYPGERVLQNTVILFRKKFHLNASVHKASGWLIGESRYKLFVNGNYLQFGPPPSDPRWTECDPVNLTEYLKKGQNCIGVQVLYFGQGDGTWPMGKPGLLFKLDIILESNERMSIVSDDSWRAYLAKSWPPGQYKRWYLRALQEAFDARRYPYGWTTPHFTMNANWLSALTLRGQADKPAITSSANDYLFNSSAENEEDTSLQKRSVPLLRHVNIKAKRLAESHWLKWERPPEEYFQYLTPDSYRAKQGTCAVEQGDSHVVNMQPNNAAVLTFEFGEQIVGWPHFSVRAPEGTVIELMVQEGHRPFGTQPDAPALMNNRFHSWTRFICKEGWNTFETFDFESLRWVQLHIRNAQGKITVKNVGCRRRLYPWLQKPEIQCSNNTIQKVLDAAVNTINNAAQETIVDCMGRERQQYSGDIGHALHSLFNAFGAKELSARYIKTFSQGLTRDGYFMDCWPAYDRLNRIAQRQLYLTPWGPLIDHGVGFNFDCYHYFMYTGDLSMIEYVLPKLIDFFHFIQNLPREKGVLATQHLGTPAVWIEHGVSNQNVQCSFNLYTAAMLKHAFAYLCQVFGKKDIAAQASEFSDQLLQNTVNRFWSQTHRMFVSNLPWIKQEGDAKLHDRTLATAILFDQCPNNDTVGSINTLATCPKNLHLSYPANHCWRYWALGKAGRCEVILNDIEYRWGAMPSVHQNNTLSENWHPRPDTTDQWSHNPTAPLYVMFMDIAGIRPLAPGFGRVEIKPQLAYLDALRLACRTVRGSVSFESKGLKGNRLLKLSLPEGIVGELVVNKNEQITDFPQLEEADPALQRIQLKEGTTFNINLEYS